MVLAYLPSRRHLARGEAPSTSVNGTPDCRWNRQNRTIRFAKPDSPVSTASSRSFRLLSDSCGEHILATPLGNRSSPAMTHYGMEIYNNNIIMPSIYTNPEVRYTNYLLVGNSFSPSCGNCISRVEQENFPLNSSAAFSQPTTMQQVMPMNDLYGRSNLDSLANCFGHSYATRVARTVVTPISCPVPCTVASGFHSAQYAANHYSQMNDCASTSQNFCDTSRSLPKSYSCQPNTPYMLPTISYYNSVSDLHRHRTMEEQLDKTPSKDSPSHSF
jgi:hypothetical protein